MNELMLKLHWFDSMCIFVQEMSHNNSTTAQTMLWSLSINKKFAVANERATLCVTVNVL